MRSVVAVPPSDTKRLAQAEDWFWLIDPLDGTKGFVRGGEAFTVNIALIHAGRPVAGPGKSSLHGRVSHGGHAVNLGDTVVPPPRMRLRQANSC